MRTKLPYKSNNKNDHKSRSTDLFFSSSGRAGALGGGGRSSMGSSSWGGVGGVLSNSAIGASSGTGATELLSIADSFSGDTLPAFLTIVTTMESAASARARTFGLERVNASTRADSTA